MVDLAQITQRSHSSPQKQEKAHFASKEVFKNPHSFPSHWPRHSFHLKHFGPLVDPPPFIIVHGCPLPPPAVECVSLFQQRRDYVPLDTSRLAHTRRRSSYVRGSPGCTCAQRERRFTHRGADCELSVSRCRFRDC